MVGPDSNLSVYGVAPPEGVTVSVPSLEHIDGVDAVVALMPLANAPPVYSNRTTRSEI